MRSRLLLTALTGLLVVTLVTGGFAGSTVADASDPIPENVTTQDPDDVRIDPALETDAGTTSSDDGTVDVLIDLESFDHKQYRMSAADDSTAARIAAMQSHAEGQQTSLKTFVEATDGVEIQRSFWLTNTVLVTLDANEVDIGTIARIDNVERISEEPTFEAPDVDSDPVKTTQNDTELDWSVKQINAAEAWEEYDTKGEGVSVAVLDTGIDPDHPDLDLYSEDPGDPTYPGGWVDFENGKIDPDSRPDDQNGHGTMSAGVIAGGDARGAYVGVAPEVDLLAARALEGGSIIGSVEWAVVNDVDIVSMSLGCPAPGECGTVLQEVRNAERLGTTVVASSGNSGGNFSSLPGVYYDSISVGATNESKGVAEFSSGDLVRTDERFGKDAPEDWPDEYIVPTVAAPGEDTLSTGVDGQYKSFTGTSAAAPHVSGALALMESATEEEHSPEELREALTATATKPKDWDEDNATWSENGQDSRYGYGIIDVPAAIEYLKSESGGSPEIETFEVQDRSEPGYFWNPDRTDLTVDWNVRSDEATLSDVTVDVIDPDGSTVATFDGQEGSERYTEQGTFGEEFTVELTATTTSGETVCERLVGPADGNSTNFESESCGGTAEGELRTNDVRVTASEIDAGENVTIELDVENVGDAPVTEYVFATANGDKAGFNGDGGRLVELDAGEATTIQIEAQPGPGEYTIGSTAPVVDGVDLPTLTVLGAQFRTADIRVPNPVDGAAYADVEIKNTGTLTGDKTTRILIGGAETLSFASVSDLAPGETQNSTVQLNAGLDPGEYDVSTFLPPLNSDSYGTIRIVDGADPVVTDYEIASEAVRVNETFELTATIENRGNATTVPQTTYVTADGENTDQRLSFDENYAPGETKTETVEAFIEEPGEYEIGTGMADKGVSNPTVSVVDSDGDSTFRTTNVTLSERRVGLYDQPKIFAEITNVGDGFGAVKVKPKYNNETQSEVKRVELDAGESKTITLQTYPPGEGAWNVGTTVPKEKGLDLPTMLVENQKKGGTFETTNLELSESEVEAGETVEVETTVQNVGEESGNTFVDLTVDGEVVPGSGNATNELDTLESETVTLEYTPEEPGEYELAANPELSSDADPVTLTVTGDSEFRATDVRLSTDTAEPGETVRVDADITNVGGSTGTEFLTLTIDGEPPGIAPVERSIELASGETGTVSFNESFENPGNYDLGVTTTPEDGVEFPTLTVEEDAEAAFETTDVRVDPASVDPGESFDVEIQVENVGDAAGSRVVTLAVDNESVGGVNQLTGSVDPGDTTTVNFTYSLDETGEYTIGSDVPSADGVESATLSVERSSGADPSIETFDVDDQSTPGSWYDPAQAQLAIDWAVTHDGNALEDVNVSVRNLDRQLVREEYAGSTGGETYVDSTGYYDDEYGETFRVRLEAVDEDGDRACTQVVGPADGDSSNLERSGC